MAAAVNILMAFLETAVFCICQYSFMKNNDQVIYSRKIYYFFGFFVLGAGSFGFTIVGRIIANEWITLEFQVIWVIVLGLLLFHRKVLDFFLDLLFSVMLFLAMEVGIMLLNFMLFSRSLILNVWSGSIIMAVKIVLMVCVTALVVSWRKQQQIIRVKKKQIALVLSLPLFSILFMYSLVRVAEIYIDLMGSRLILINVVALLLVNFCFLYLFSRWMRADQLEQELRAFQIQSELQYKYYEDMERKYRESRKILHDMKNHLQAVESLYREGAGSNADEESRGNRYVKDLYHMVNMLGEKFYSSNHMLNIICNDKLSAARRRGIRVVAEIGDVDFSDLKDIDITTIFANLLDNATDAAAESGQDRFIEMKIQEIQNFRVISIINSIPEQRLLTYEPGKVDRSAQPDRQGRSIDADQQGIPAEHLVMHALAGGGTAYAVQRDRANRQKKKGHMGIGLENVRRTLAVYHGTLQCEETGGEYRVSIMLPKKEEL